jgi:hypothetical protein
MAASGTLHAVPDHTSTCGDSVIKNVWLDCDPGHDDAFAIILAGWSGSIKLLGVSTVHGNQSAHKTYVNAVRVLHASGLQHVCAYRYILEVPYTHTHTLSLSPLSLTKHYVDTSRSWKLTATRPRGAYLSGNSWRIGFRCTPRCRSTGRQCSSFMARCISIERLQRSHKHKQ